MYENAFGGEDRLREVLQVNAEIGVRFRRSQQIGFYADGVKNFVSGEAPSNVFIARGGGMNSNEDGAYRGGDIGRHATVPKLLFPDRVFRRL